MNAMTPCRFNIAAGALFCAAATAAYSQAPTAGSSPTSALVAPTGAPTNQPLVHLAGTDFIRGLPPITLPGLASQGFIDTTSYNYLAADTKGILNLISLLNASREMEKQP